jgi:membrane associated rhomboid family serine protease
LRRLGALEPSAVLAQGEYWRLLTALFLHYGALHLLVNLYALHVLGPPLEASLGPLRFAVCYLVAGIGSSAGVVALWHLGWTQSNLLVGASGAVMGIVGAWAGLLMRHHHLPMARRRLIIIGLIVLMQTAIDFYMPQISVAAHLCGLVTGLAVGLVLAPRREAW